MRLLLFTLLCLLTLLVIRFLQRSAAGRTERQEPKASTGGPAASDDEIIDVRFEETPRRDPKGDEAP